MADQMLLSSSRVLPRKLVQAGYAFRDPALEGALRRILFC
jgi:NAD dependent epimerase/dehydratase family enzyme